MRLPLFSLFSGPRAFALGLLLSIAFAPPARAQEAGDSHNLLQNASFESGMDGWTIGRGTAAIDPAEKHGASSALRIDSPKGEDSMVVQKVTVAPNSRYRLTGYIKTKSVLSVKRGGKDGASLAVRGGFLHTPMVYGSKSWTRVYFDFATGQETEIEVGPRLGMYSGLVTGTAWYAELSLVELGHTYRQLPGGRP